MLIILIHQAALPFAVVGSTQIIVVGGRKVRGRMYPWGVVEVENPEHSDFIKLRTMLMLVNEITTTFPSHYLHLTSLRLTPSLPHHMQCMSHLNSYPHPTPTLTYPHPTSTLTPLIPPLLSCTHAPRTLTVPTCKTYKK